VKRNNLDVKSLSTRERLDWLDEIWTSLTDAPDEVRLTEAQRAELDRRLDDLEQDTVRGIPWDGVLDRIRRRAG